jgi:hypothetical protein
MSQNVYIEDTTITIPVLKDGVHRIGDLWNCRESKIVGENLFKQNLDGIYVNASPIESLEYQLIHSKSVSDKFRSINIGGEVALEMKAGLIEVKGLVNYDHFNDQQSNKEQLICNYSRETYSVYAQSNADELINESVVNKLLTKEVNATHLVRGVILGAEVKADILITHDLHNKRHDIQGNIDFMGKLIFGPMNALVKTNLGFLDNKDFEDYKKEINIHSIPALKLEPKTIEEMFQMIENIGTQVEDQKHFPECGDKVVGVPIRFILVPINQYIKIKNERLYLKISHQILKDFEDMLIRVQDIQIPANISRKVLESNSSLGIILNDPDSKLSNDIVQYEKKLNDIGRRYFEESVDIFKKYKIGALNADNLVAIRNKFETECNSSDIFEKILEFINEGEG